MAAAGGGAAGDIVLRSGKVVRREELEKLKKELMELKDITIRELFSVYAGDDADPTLKRILSRALTPEVLKMVKEMKTMKAEAYSHECPIPDLSKLTSSGELYKKIHEKEEAIKAVVEPIIEQYYKGMMNQIPADFLKDEVADEQLAELMCGLEMGGGYRRRHRKTHRKSHRKAHRKAHRGRRHSRRHRKTRRHH